MRDPNRIKPMLALLEAAWLQQPDMRLGQLIVNITGHDPLYVEDAVLAEKLRALVPTPDSPT